VGVAQVPPFVTAWRESTDNLAKYIKRSYLGMIPLGNRCTYEWTLAGVAEAAA